LTVLKLALLAATAAASTATPPTLVANTPWWEKITVTVNDDGNAHGCEYQTSLAGAAQSCDVSGDSKALAAGAGGPKGAYTRITFERRFSPGSAPDTGKLHAGDTLLGGQVMALAIDGSGAVNGCRVVAKSGGMTPDYGCAEARAEKFETSARSAVPSTQGYLTILVYGHSEQLV
jgi:hypothetical protein